MGKHFLYRANGHGSAFTLHDSDTLQPAVAKSCGQSVFGFLGCQ